MKNKSWSEQALLSGKLPPSKLVFVKHKDGNYYPAIIKSINEDGTVTVIESNRK